MAVGDLMRHNTDYAHRRRNQWHRNEVGMLGTQRNKLYSQWRRNRVGLMKLILHSPSQTTNY